MGFSYGNFNMNKGSNNCPLCGKYFIAYEEWAYKDYSDKTHVVKFCSWSCLKKWREINPRGKNRRKGLVVTDRGR